MATGRGPDKWKFDKLKRLIETEMLKLSRAHKGQFLSDEISNRLFERLVPLGEIGKLLDCFGLQGVFDSHLTRHIVALYLFQFVFRP